MGIKSYIKRLLKIVGFTMMKAIGFSLLLGGVVEEIVWVAIIGFLIVDLSPSFIKTIWKDAGASFHGSGKHE